jgi:tetratricopeptide (TPR) repeat protein
MKKIILTILLWSLLPSGRTVFALENKDLRGLYIRSIEQVLRLEPDEVDLATAVLIISEQWSDNVYGRRYVHKLDDMAEEIKRRIRAKNSRSMHSAISIINKYLFDEMGFESVKEADDPEDLFLHSVIDRKQGYCLSLSALYLAIGERLGLPLYGVVVPGHFFVRYDDGKVRFNIETTSNGDYADDDHYINKFNVPIQDEDGIYMRNLNKMQTLGCFFNNLGNAYTDVGDEESAFRSLQNAVQINPTLSESRANLGNLYLKMERMDDAIYEYRAAIGINPSDAKSHNNIANAYSRLDWLDEAISEYELAIYLDPNFASAYKNLARAYIKKEMYIMAEYQLTQAEELAPKDGDVHVQFGRLYLETGDCHKAIISFKRAIRYDSQSSDAYFGLGTCYHDMGNAEEEIYYIKKGLSVQPDVPAAVGNLGNAYFSLEQFDKAIEQYHKAINLNPKNGTFYFNVGAAYYNMDHFDQAVSFYLRCVELKPEFAEGYNSLAHCYYQMEKYETAHEYLKAASQLGYDIKEDLMEAIEDRL